MPGMKPGRSGWLPGLPKYGVNCWAKFTVTYLDVYTRSREVQTFERCIETCPTPRVYFTVRSRREDDIFSVQRDSIDKKASAIFQVDGPQGLGELKCLQWVRDLK
jgi:hypothetical protein